MDAPTTVYRTWTDKDDRSWSMRPVSFNDRGAAARFARDAIRDPGAWLPADAVDWNVSFQGGVRVDDQPMTTEHRKALVAQAKELAGRLKTAA